MMSSYINPPHVTEEYAQRLHDCARQTQFHRVPHDSVMRQRLGCWIIGLGERLQGQLPPTAAEPAKVQLTTS